MKSALKLLILTLTYSASTMSSLLAEDLLPFERLTARIAVACSGSRTSPDGYDVVEITDCKNQRLPGGFRFNDGPGHPYLGNVTTPYPDGLKPVRTIEFESRDNAFNETNLYLEDLAGGPDSHDVKSVVLLLPRLGVPIVSVDGNEVSVTLTTGEDVVFDKISHGLIRGALKEGPIDLTTDRFKRQPPNVKYVGAGISIRVNHRFEYPTQGATTAEVTQGSRVCQISKNSIWDAAGKLTTQDDKSLVEILNKKCTKKPGEVDFHI